MLIFVLPTKKRLVVLFWTFFKFLGNQGELEKNRNHRKVLLMQGYLSEVKLANPFFCFKSN